MGTPPTFERVLPGFSPKYTRTELTRDDVGRWFVTHTAGDGPGFVTRRDVERYGPLSWNEALDVLGAIYDAYEPA